MTTNSGAAAFAAVSALMASAVLLLSSVPAFSALSHAETTASGALTVLRASASPIPPPHSVSLGPMAAAARVHFDVTLKLPDPGAVTAFIASLSDRVSPNFHHFLRPGQFSQIFGPALSAVSAVEAVLRSEGLHPGEASTDRLLIPVTASASAIDRAFHVRLVRYRLPDGRTAFTTLAPPSISSLVSRDVDGVVGLSDLVQPQSLLASARAHRTLLPRSSALLHPRTAGPTPCTAAASIASSYGGYTADELAAFYGMTPLYSLGDFGQGVHVALAEFQADLPSDISAYQACYGTSATVNYIPVDGGAPPSTDVSPEAAMDIEDLIGLAPQATIDVYQAPSGSNGDALDVYSTIVDDDTDPVVSTSWGECEQDQEASDSSFLGTEQSLFQQAATQGQTVFAAAGDAGSTDCLGDAKSPNQDLLAVDDPASQPYVVGVGGTSIAANSETVWNDVSGAGGGGVSSTWCMPSYQDQSGIEGLMDPDSELSDLVPGTNCATGSYMREVPDVTADADPASGYVVYWEGSWSGADGFLYGGTSAAAPLWAAAAALIDSSPFCADYDSGHAGVQPEGLYLVAGLGSALYDFAFNDITTGSNYVPSSGYSGGLYPATAGFDMASGLGSPKLAYDNNYYPGLAAQLCLEYGTQNVTTKIIEVSPDAGPSGQSTTITIEGSGFLPIAGADRLQVGTSWITVSCSTSTSCTATLPASGPGTINLVMSVEDMTLSPVEASDQFTFAAPPSVSAITPAAGPSKGGTKVTIHGSNFVGTVSVAFGDKTATAVQVISPSEISVAVPPGSGAAPVTVSTVGGSSPNNAASTYTFLPAPTITKISPAYGPEAAGTEVTIEGSNFVGNVSVRFGGKLASHVHVVSASEVTARAPSGSGAVDVLVSASGGSGDRPAGGYVFVPAPTIKRISPAQGPREGGTRITIYGSNFVGAVSVRFGTRASTHVRVVSASQITAIAPPGSGTVFVIVSAAGGPGRDEPAGSYRY